MTWQLPIRLTRLVAPTIVVTVLASDRVKYLTIVHAYCTAPQAVTSSNILYTITIEDMAIYSMRLLKTTVKVQPW